MTLERTKSIIDDCLTAYLKLKLDNSQSAFDNADNSYFSYSPGAQADGTRSPGTPGMTSARSKTVSDQEKRADEDESSPDEPLSASIKNFAEFAAFQLSPLRSPRRIAKPVDTPSLPTNHRVPRKPLPSQTIAGSSIQSLPPNPQNTPPANAPRMSSMSQRRPKATSPLSPEQSITPEQYQRAKRIFRPLEDDMIQNYGAYDSLNTCFSTYRSRVVGRTHSESALRTPPPERTNAAPQPQHGVSDARLPQVDAKTLLLGDFAENGDWWTGQLERQLSVPLDAKHGRPGRHGITSKSPCIDWTKLDKWYEAVQSCERDWQARVNSSTFETDAAIKTPILTPRARHELETDLRIARDHVERALFKITENLLRRPGRLLKEPQDIRFLLIVMSNPLLYPRHVQERRLLAARGRSSRVRPGSVRRPSASTAQTNDPSKHAGILKRCFGLLAGSSDVCHRYMINWFSRMPEGRFLDLVDLVSSFVSYRLSRRKTVSKKINAVDDNGLIPDLTGSALRTSTQLQRAAGLSGGTKSTEKKASNEPDYADDWQLRAAAKVMTLLFAANNQWPRPDPKTTSSPLESLDRDPRPRSALQGQLLPVSDFYISLLDFQDVIADFKAWESKKPTLTFCSYPFFLSIGAKIRILEYDAKRQQDTVARETFFNNVILGHNAGDVYLQLSVRRECVVEDSLKRISEVTGGSQGDRDLKKTLKVHFLGEEGIDAGGLRKEWFLLLVRDIFDPEHGLFIYDEDSRLAYFNPHSFETSDQYFLVGVLLGLAIFNSTILDVPLPPFAFRKLLASGPLNPGGPSPSTVTVPGIRSTMAYTLDDLAEYRPSLAQGLRQLLSFEGDVQSTYMWSFTAPVSRYGVVTEHLLCPDGAKRPVTNANRQEFVALYVRFLLDTLVARQFDPFKRGFFTVCAGNALSLFRAEEIELLVRGAADARLDVDALKAVAVYEGFRSREAGNLPIKGADVPEKVEIVKWFWEFFREAEGSMQRRLLQFITGSDRVPAVGAAGLVLKVQAGGDGTGVDPAEENRFPVARTCFNAIVLWGWKSRKRLETMVRGAVEGSEGFGLK